MEASGTQNKAGVIYAILDLGMSTSFPEKKNHSSDKSWITHHVKNLIAKRQAAFISANDQEWRKLRSEVKHEIEMVKTKYYATRIQGLQYTEPRKWYQA